jgi:hypothetical protein
MDKGRAIRDKTVLADALAALRQKTGLEAEIIQPNGPHGLADALIEIKGANKKYKFLAEVKTARYFATVGWVKDQLGPLDRNVYPLLVAPYITRAIAEHCRVLRLPFLDTVGNAYLEAPGLMVYITGEPRPDTAEPDPRYRAYTTVGMKIVFALLCRPDLAQVNYRTLAKAAQVALGTIGPVMADLKNRGFLVQREKKVLQNTKKLLEDWVLRFPDTLRPKLLINRYLAEKERLLALDLPKQKAYWGGEVAAERLTGYLKPEQFTIYQRGGDQTLLAKGRMRLDRNGNTEILQAFWGFEDDPGHPELAPPLLVYADLMATQDGRNLETAHLLYERFLKPTHRP